MTILETFNCVQTNDKHLIKLLVLDSDNWNLLTVCKEMSRFTVKNNVTNKLFAYKSYIYIYIYIYNIYIYIYIYI